MHFWNLSVQFCLYALTVANLYVYLRIFTYILNFILFSSKLQTILTRLARKRVTVVRIITSMVRYDKSTVLVKSIFYSFKRLLLPAPDTIPYDNFFFFFKKNCSFFKKNKMVYHFLLQPVLVDFNINKFLQVFIFWKYNLYDFELLDFTEYFAFWQWRKENYRCQIKIYHSIIPTIVQLYRYSLNTRCSPTRHFWNIECVVCSRFFMGVLVLVNIWERKTSTRVVNENRNAKVSINCDDLATRSCHSA